MDGATERLHATAISVSHRAALIRGPSGAGKSDLALRCLSIGVSTVTPIAAKLVADDQTLVTRRGITLIASAPAAIAGRLEVRGVGIVTLDYTLEAIVVLIVDLGANEPQPRFPAPWPMEQLLGLNIPILRLDAFAASAATKVLAALRFPELPEVALTARSELR
ncbi:MAG: HPr kinase/phosphorylase [Hyphomicrobium sp.]